MIFLKSNFERWLIMYSKNLASSIFYKRISEAAMNFLLTSKLVTKSFSGLSFVDSYSGTEIKKLHRILLVNIRKSIPMIKAGDMAYKFPFVQFYNRSGVTYLYFEDTNNNRRTLERYFRFIKLRNYLVDNDIPVSLDSEFQRQVVGGIQHNLIRIRIGGASRNNSYLNYSLVFLLPKMLRILKTLHRKAYFTDDNLLSATSNTSSSGESVDDVGDDEPADPAEPFRGPNRIRT